MKNILLLSFLTIALITGCTSSLKPVKNGRQPIHDQRKFSVIKQDFDINHYVKQRVKHDARFKNSHIVVSAHNHNVLLAGQTPDAPLRAVVEQYAEQAPKVGKIFNEIEIRGLPSSLSRSSDTWITTKVKAKMFHNKDLQSGAIKVVTENGTVYLLGKTSRDQAALAANTARRVSGVQRVVKLFGYTHDQQA